jgi:hypothetical protein
MILQRLHGRGTLASSVEQVASGLARPLLKDCKRVREERISLGTGGYSQARRKLPKGLVERVQEEMLERLRAELSESWPGLSVPVFLLDGSSLQLEASGKLVKAYPPGGNQHGANHWPVLKLVVFHDVGSGLAQKPVWGAMYGPKAESEQKLAQKAIGNLSAGAVVMADANFGIFFVAWESLQKGHPVLLRLTAARARKLCGPMARAGEYPVVWKPSAHEQKRHGYSEDSAVAGRLIAVRIGRGKSKQWLYLFTTLELPQAEVVRLYGHRWNIETDLRSLKTTVRLQHITAQSVDMLEKELLMAISAYNLVRAVMALAARRARVDPRQLSFQRVLGILDCAWPRLVAAQSNAKTMGEFERVVDLAAQCLLPKRHKRRKYPRSIWSRGYRFPTHRHGKTK